MRNHVEVFYIDRKTGWAIQIFDSTGAPTDDPSEYCPWKGPAVERAVEIAVTEGLKRVEVFTAQNLLQRTIHATGIKTTRK